MVNPFLLLYRYFRSRKVLFYILLTIISTAIAFSASRIRFEEDISGMSGGKDTANLFEYVTTHHNFAEKIVVTFSQTDTTIPSDPEKLTSAADIFSDSLRSSLDSSFIKEIRSGIPDSVQSAFIDFFYDNIPFYLNENDYKRISGWLNRDTLSRIVERNYHNLVTPAGFALKQSISRDQLGLTFLGLNKLRSLSAGDNYDLVDGYIFTKDHRHLLLFITPANPPSETSKNGILVYKIDKLLENIQKNYSVKTSFFGAAAMAAGNAEQLKKDIVLTLSIAILLIISLIGWYFRSLKVPILGFLPALFGGGFALAIMALTKGTVSAIALGIGSVILGLIIDYVLYIINHFRRTGNIETVIKEMSPAILLCALTTAGAFLCLIFLRSSVLHDLGWFAALSVTGAAIFALVILPQLLNEKDSLIRSGKNNLVDRITSVNYDKNPFLLGALVVMIVIGGFFMKHIDFEKNMMALNFTTDKLARAQADLEKITDVTLKNIYVISTGKSIDEALRANEKVNIRLNSLRDSGFISSFSGTGSLMLSDSLRDHRLQLWKNFWTDEKKKFLREELIRAGSKYGFKENYITSSITLIDKDYKSANQELNSGILKYFLRDYIQENKVFMITAIARVTEEMKPKAHEKIKTEGNIVVFDRQQITDRFIAGVKRDFDLLVTLSMVFVTLLLLISFGRIEIAFFAAIPMYASWLITLGFMGITGLKFNIFNIILSSFIFGLGVDYSILMMQGLLHKYKYGIDNMVSVRTSVFLSAVTTIIGVAALFLARHPALNSIALISVVGVSAVLLVTFTLQPYLFEKLISERTARGRFPVTLRLFIKTVVTWTNIVLIAIILMITGPLLFIIPLPSRKKEYFFHLLFSKLSKIYIAVTFPGSASLINENHEDFKKPSVIISNHQSLIETPLFLRLHPKILILTNDWVWNSPLFGLVARLASFLNAEKGLDSVIEELRKKVNEGYSILIFPEAHRSVDGHIQRFHRGAFYLAEKLGLDILPVIVFGSGEFLGKNAFFGRPSPLTMKILKRVSPEDHQYGKTYSERTRGFRKLMRNEYEQVRNREENTHYYRKKLILNYIYKGPVLEWYLRVKMILSDNYSTFDKLIPRSGKILDIGCGYGYISYMLMMTGSGRRITGVDHDGEKILVAQNGFLKNEKINFIEADITSYEIEKSSAFILSDVLHYIEPEQQKKLLYDCIENLEDGGVILIRDADSSKEKEHKSSKFTEFLSTRVIGFNKTVTADRKLNFTSFEEINNVAEEFGLKAEIMQEAKNTSNILVVIRK